MMFGRFICSLRASPEERKQSRAFKSAALLFMFTFAFSRSVFAAGDAEHGATVYRQCMACHALDKNGVGPSHLGVVGRRAGSVSGYEYSAALKASNIVWDQAALDKWLTNPQALVPGANMYFSLASAQDRADVIEYLKVKASGGPANGAEEAHASNPTH
jgi:cytochrome c